MKDRLLIVDGLNTFIRNWAVVPSMNTNGEPNGGVLGFLRSIKVVMKDVRPAKVIVVWDGKGGSAKRRSIYSDYKAGRKPRVNRQYDFESVDESQANLKYQYVKTRQLLDMLGVIQVEVDEVEADDIIALIAHHIFTDMNKVIMSTDRDFFQLIDSHTLVFSPTKKIYYSSAELKERLNVLPENYIYLKSLIGDGSDNVKGIKGIGEKTAVKLFPFLSERKTSLEEIFVHAEANREKSPKYPSVLESREHLMQNVKLMQLSNPIISVQAAMSTRHQLENSPAKFNFSEFKLVLIRDGVQLTDSDFFATFQEYQQRFQKEERPNV